MLTIGYGTNIERISREEAEWRLLELSAWQGKGGTGPRIPHYRRPRVSLSGVSQALDNMAYQMGVPRLKQFKRMWAALKVSRL